MCVIVFRSKVYGRDEVPHFLCRRYNNTFSEEFIDFRFNNSMLFSVKNTGSLMLLRWGWRISLCKVITLISHHRISCKQSINDKLIYQRHVSRLRHPFPFPDYLSARFARRFFFARTQTFSSFFPQCGAWSQATTLIKRIISRLLINFKTQDEKECFRLDK